MAIVLLFLFHIIAGIDTGVSVQQAKTTVTAMLKDITIYDPHPASLYPKVCHLP